KKTAERIILELSGTLAKTTGSTSDEALDALERLGYSRREAAEALRHVAATGDVRDRIRAALKMLSAKP
ncbi:MAG: Holliday junction branch migration protein RuvA, partial [Candidatus Kerfeldbacteria bacterium]|nr:Holliday junction branch migration protein RuvA [Candidatus Kerfeldbacteria bacterium]